MEVEKRRKKNGEGKVVVVAENVKGKRGKVVAFLLSLGGFFVKFRA